MEYMDLSAESQEAQAKHMEHMRILEAKQRARAVMVPTDQQEIRQRLRELGHPVTLFGEGPADRRERLRDVIAALELSEEDLARMQEIMNQKAGGLEVLKSTTGVGLQKEMVYSAASEELIAIRIYLAEYSFARAKNRLLAVHQIRSNTKLQAEEDGRAAVLYNNCRDMTLNASQFADERPGTRIRYSLQGEYIASSSLACNVKIWNSRNLTLVYDLKGHEERVTSVAWYPGMSDKPFLASTSADASCILWDASIDATADRPTKIVQQFKGHEGCVLSCDFHPSSRLLGTCGVDTTLRLWDIETGKEVQLQDGHFKECSSLAFQRDGGLVLSTDWAGVALLWDLRSGQAVQTFQGHIKKITCSSFSPNGYQVATGSTDNMVRIWDLRKKKCGYSLPAHTNCISDVRYSTSGELLLTSSFDGTVKIWGTRDFQLLRALAGHAGKVMSADIHSDEKHVCSVGFDRTLKLWAHKSEF